MRVSRLAAFKVLAARLLPGLLLALASGAALPQARPPVSAAAPATAAAPCTLGPADRAPDSLAARICADPDLAPLEARLQHVFTLAEAQTVRWGLPSPRADQARWQRGRAACLKEADARGCLALGARRRIAELLAVYALVQGTAPRGFNCAEQATVTLSFFATEPASAVARRGDDTIVLYAEPAGAGLRYAGGGWVFAEQQGEVRITAGRGAPELRCRLAR